MCLSTSDFTASRDAFALSQRDPRDRAAVLGHHPTIPRSELSRAVRRGLLDMVKAVVDLGSRRRTLLFMRADWLAHFVLCLVYLPHVS